MSYNYFIGIDVSKKTLDFSLLENGKQLFHSQVSNDIEGIKSIFNKLKNEFGIKISQVLFCLEHTGIYGNTVLNYLHGKRASIWLESAVHIKASGGLQRGKSDKVDAFRIAVYAYKNVGQARLWEPARKELQKLNALLAMRARLVNVRTQLESPLKEQEGYVDKQIQASLKKSNKATIDALKNDIVGLDRQIQEVIDKDPQLKEYFELLTSIEGVGKVIATQVIVATNEFKKFTSPKAFACHAGVAPFPYQSGSSIKGRNRVSHKADKNLKKLLQLAAVRVIQIKGELQDYYLRKVAEGKHKMSILNAIRNKIILRIFAVITKNKKYEKNYTYSLV